jgi:hypothetical protein
MADVASHREGERLDGSRQLFSAARHIARCIGAERNGVGLADRRGWPFDGATVNQHVAAQHEVTCPRAGGGQAAADEF